MRVSAVVPAHNEEKNIRLPSLAPRTKIDARHITRADCCGQRLHPEGFLRLPRLLKPARTCR
jgi:hypothetical protein